MISIVFRQRQLDAIITIVLNEMQHLNIFSIALKQGEHRTYIGLVEIVFEQRQYKATITIVFEQSGYLNVVLIASKQG